MEAFIFEWFVLKERTFTRCTDGHSTSGQHVTYSVRNCTFGCHHSLIVFNGNYRILSKKFISKYLSPTRKLSKCILIADEPPVL